MPYTIEYLADMVGGTVYGDPTIVIDSVNSLEDAKAGQISFLSNPKFVSALKQTTASAVLLKESEREDCPAAAIVVDNPYAAYAKIAGLIYPLHKEQSGIHPTAVIGDNCEIDESVWVGPQCVIGNNVKLSAGTYISAGVVIEDNVRIGEACTFYPNVTVMHDCVFGNNVLVHAGSVIGSDGFGQANENGTWHKIPQIGRVLIGDDVEIGANNTIDRGTIKDTIIKEGVKLDNLVHIAHNVVIGEHTVIAAQTGIAGSTTIGKNCMFGGVVGVAGHLDIADNVTLTGRAVARQSISKAGVYSSGTPLEENRLWHRNHARFKQLDDMAKRLKKLEKTIEELAGKNIE